MKWILICVCALIPWVMGTGVLVGGPTDQKELDPDILKFALQELASGDNSLYHKKAVKVSNVSTQVVAGTNYRFTVHLADTDCLKSSGQEPSEDCQVQDGASVKECRLTVWSKPWLEFLELTHVDCDDGVSEGDTQGKGASTELPAIESSILVRNQQGPEVTSGMNELLPREASILSLQRLQSYNHFKSFVIRHKKQYSSLAELKLRFRIFRQNMKKVQFLTETEQATGKYGASQFSDLTAQEFKTNYLGLKPEFQSIHWASPEEDQYSNNSEIPLKFDWREHGAVTPVKNQGACGSCWAFSVTGNIEGQWAINRGKLIPLSEQELVDCDRLDNGCNGGLPSNAYQAIMKLGGLETETDYKYDAVDKKCSFKRTKVRVTIDSAVNLTTDEDLLAKWLVHNGPISIGINANAMQFYMGGVSHPWSFLCNKANLDHGVLIVGYGMDEFKLFKEKLPYWTIKNSWGTSWGEQGYYRVFRGDSTCGVNQMATSAIVKN
ncbi:cathepsin L-like [Tigriopus californicus]|uniref:cathepsin L-like n=1 Tax=Tigriopus californicus TaxID=6832 RepID=UPI0027DA90B6|nr:cathepsin L-like [Tigriopus californicus]